MPWASFDPIGIGETMTVGNGISDLSHFVAEFPVVAAGVQDTWVDEADNYEAQRQGCEDSPDR